VIERCDDVENMEEILAEIGETIDFIETTGKTQDNALDIFRKWDTDGNGYIDKKELEGVLTELGLPGGGVQRLIVDADVNRDGKISYQEFLGYTFFQSADALRKRIELQIRVHVLRKGVGAEGTVQLFYMGIRDSVCTLMKLVSDWLGGEQCRIRIGGQDLSPSVEIRHHLGAGRVEAFIHEVADWEELVSNDGALSRFKTIDMDNDGLIGALDMKKALNLSWSEVYANIRKGDTDRDMHLNFEEYLTWVRSSSK